jgi:N-ethylmaleimide reductase
MDAVYDLLARELEALSLTYIHVVDHSSLGGPLVKPEIKAAIRRVFKGRYILSGGYDRIRAGDDLTAGRGDLVAFGRPFISNPNLVSKLQTDHPLTPPNPATFYTAEAVGYTDYL